MDDIFVKLPHLNLTEQERNELFSIQEKLDYTEFNTPEDKPDGNCLILTPDLPLWFYQKFNDILLHAMQVLFLKNKGTIIHTDVNRKCSLTFPLSDSNVPTNFYLDEYVVTKLYHDGNTYLQNNEVTHSVDWQDEWRYFLQISFSLSFDDVKKFV